MSYQKQFPHLLDESGHLLLDLLEPGLRVGRLGGVHLVDGNDELLDTEGVGKEGVLPGLTVLGDARLKLSGSGGDDKHSTIGLAGSCDHVLDEVTMARGVNDGHIVPMEKKLDTRGTQVVEILVKSSER